MSHPAANEGEAKSNRALHVLSGQILEACELPRQKFGDDDEWVCRDPRCRVPMVPCAYKSTNQRGEAYQKSPYFRAKNEHKPGCQAAFEDRHPHRTHLDDAPSYPIPHPNHVILTAPVPRSSPSDRPDAVTAPILQDNGRHSNSVRSIRAACEFYAASQDNHRHRLLVDGCKGRSYAECFVRVGTGGTEIVGHQWIFYGEIRFKGRINYDAEPLVVPLLNAVWGEPRNVVITTEHWLTDERRDFRSRLRTTIDACKAARGQGEKRHPWLFFVSREVTCDQLEFHADLEAGIDVLVCAMPRQQRRLRQSGWHARPSDRPSGQNADHPSLPQDGVVGGAAAGSDTSSEPTGLESFNLDKEAEEAPAPADRPFESLIDDAALPMPSDSWNIASTELRALSAHDGGDDNITPQAVSSMVPDAPISLVQRIVSGIRGLFG